MLTPSRSQHTLYSLRGLRRDLRWRLTTLLVCVHYALGFGLQSPSAFTMHQVAYSEMATPYRRRVLMSWVYRLDLYFTHGRAYSFRHRVLTPEQALTIVVAFLSVLVAVWLTRRLIEHILGAGTPSRWCSLLVVYMLSCHEMLIYDVQARFAYDMPAVAFFTAGFYAAYTRNRPLFYTVLVVGTFNRETTLFLPLLLFLMELHPDTALIPALRMVKGLRYLELAGQLVLWEGLVLLCEHLTGGRGNGVVVPIGDNLRMLANPLHWPVYCSVFGFLWLPLLYFRRFLQNVPLERCSLLLPLWFAIVIVVGDPLELRLENELTPYVAVCVALVLAHSVRLRRPTATTSENATEQPNRRLALGSTERLDDNRQPFSAFVQCAIGSFLTASPVVRRHLPSKPIYEVQKRICGRQQRLGIVGRNNTCRRFPIHVHGNDRGWLRRHRGWRLGALLVHVLRGVVGRKADAKQFPLSYHPSEDGGRIAGLRSMVVLSFQIDSRAAMHAAYVGERDTHIAISRVPD